MDGQNFWGKSVKELQIYLKARGVIFADQRKADLVFLCEKADEIGIDVDPDGLLEDRNEVLKEKLLLSDDSYLPSPDSIDSTPDLSILPPFGIFDLYNYLITFDQYDHSSLRKYHKMEAFGMFEDGYVLTIGSCKLNEDYVAVKARVKPRTNEKDPISKLGYYKLWIIFSCTPEATNTGTIFSALCSCKGGIDGGCRHVVATLFEIMDYINDKTKDSVTSGPCIWVRRSTKTTEPVLVTELETSITEQKDIPKPLEDIFDPVPVEEIPSPLALINTIKEVRPSACILDSWEVREKEKKVFEKINVGLPQEKIQKYWTAHILHRCTDQCYNDFVEHLIYSAEEIVEIEKGTKGQSCNPNWTEGRKGIITSSNFKQVCHSTNFDKTASALLKDSTFTDQNMPAPISFGVKYESKARDMYLKSHRFHHKKCKIEEMGLVICSQNPMLGTSPDGILECPRCGPHLVEIKCIYKYKNFYPKPALIAAQICEKDNDDKLKLIKTHRYYYQIQGQMGITGIRSCLLIGFTLKGIHHVEVPFDEDFWENIKTKLVLFYKNHFLKAYLALNNIPFSS